MTVYMIERRVEHAPEDSRYGWELAWGFKPRSHPKAPSDAAAVATFYRETARCRRRLRLVALDRGIGYGTHLRVLAEANAS